MVVGGVNQPGDLQFKTYYDYDLGMLVTDLIRGIPGGLLALFPLLSIFVFPGYLVLSALASRRYLNGLDPVEHCAIMVGLSMAILPLVLLLTSLLKVKLTREVVVACAIFQGAIVGIQLWKTRFTDLRRWSQNQYSHLVVGFSIVFIITAALRYLHIRGLVVPAWVDGVHHTLITKLIVEQGGIPESYVPYLQVDKFVYHYGFHTLTAAYAWLTGLEIPHSVLIIGQVINTLMVSGVYLLMKRLGGSSIASLVGCMIPGTISLMPAYFVTWGRYTQLTGLVLLPTVFALSQDVLEAPNLRKRSLVLAGLAIAGLTVTHYRVLIFICALIAAYILVQLVPRREHVKQLLWRISVLMGLSVLIAAPWIVHVLTTQINIGRLDSWFHGADSFNAVPWSLVDVGLNRVLMVLAGFGLIWGLWRRAHAVVLITCWSIILIIMVNPNLFGLSSMWLINNSSLVISLFLPLALLIGYLVGELCNTFMASMTRDWQVRFTWGGLVALTIIAMWGASGMLSVVNPVTIVATQDDIAAMEWIKQNVPSDAHFLINVREWQVGAYMGSDGGYWIPILTGHQTVMPPAIYTQGTREYIKEISEVGKVISSAHSFEDPDLRKLIEQNHITYVYLGARGGTLTPQMLLQARGAHLLYSTGAVWIFSLDSVS